MRNTPERATRERILEVAEAFLGEYGYHGTRLHHIAHRVGIQKASLFHYFPSKEHLYRAVLEEGFGETEQTLRRALEGQASPLEKIRALIEAYVDMVAAHPSRTRILLRLSLGDAPEGYETSNSERLLQLLAAFVGAAQEAKALAPIDPVQMILSVIGMVAFFFTSGPVVAPTFVGDPLKPAAVERIKRHVVDVVQRCLAGARASDVAEEAALSHVAAQPTRAAR